MRCRCKAHTRSGDQCRNLAVEGTTVCYMHGAKAALNPDNGKDGGRPITHALYSKSVPDDWRERYEYFKTDPNYLSLSAEIALAQTNMDRFLDKLRGATFDDEKREHLMAHLDQIGKLKEKENKRVYNEKLVNELIAQQVEEEARVLAQVLANHVDPDTAESIVREFASGVREACKISTSLSVADTGPC
jgi:chorismate mutase